MGGGGEEVWRHLGYLKFAGEAIFFCFGFIWPCSEALLVFWHFGTLTFLAFGISWIGMGGGGEALRGMLNWPDPKFHCSSFVYRPIGFKLCRAWYISIPSSMYTSQNLDIYPLWEALSVMCWHVCFQGPKTGPNPAWQCCCCAATWPLDRMQLYPWDCWGRPLWSLISSEPPRSSPPDSVLVQRWWRSWQLSLVKFSYMQIFLPRTTCRNLYRPPLDTCRFPLPPLVETCTIVHL
jgi:hypothetical protein